MTIKKVWIEEGCISCNLCEDICPEVFSVPPGETSQIRPKWAKFIKKKREQILEAEEYCPVEVIRVEKED